MSDWLILGAGFVMVAMVVSERGRWRQAWRRPARWWRLDEYAESRSPSQPLNAVAGLILGLAAVTYGVVALLS